jgi:phosphatidylserine/phosphatidylglycerophosphate/cardiolipin synthase-like enzyme
LTPPEIELVLTLPGADRTRLYQPDARTTVGCLVQLLTEAKKHVVIAAPFMQRGQGLSGGPLAIALESALTRGLRVDVLGTREGLSTLSVEKLSRRSKGLLGLWEPSHHIADRRYLGSHAKFCIADAEAAYIGSANFTGPGLGDQLEMGVLVRGPIAAQIGAFWALASRTGFFTCIATLSGRAALGVALIDDRSRESPI